MLISCSTMYLASLLVSPTAVVRVVFPVTLRPVRNSTTNTIVDVLVPLTVVEITGSVVM